ncbi:hypothetical protein D3C87_1112080 [compost metagenome]
MGLQLQSDLARLLRNATGLVDDDRAGRQAFQQAFRTEDQAVHIGAARQTQQDHVALARQVDRRSRNDGALRLEALRSLGVHVPDVELVRSEQSLRECAAHRTQTDITNRQCHFSKLQ